MPDPTTPASTPAATAAVLGALADRSFAAVLFDLDGTLVDSTAAVERSWRRWATEFGVELTGFGDWHGVPSDAVVSHLLPESRVSEGVLRIVQIEISDVAGVVLLPGAAQALAALPNGRSAIVTSCSRKLAVTRIAVTGLIGPAVIVTADQVKIGKPDPAPYLLAARRLGVDPADCLVVEDAPAGLTSAKAAGMARLAVTTTHAAADLDADAIVRDLAAVRFTAGPDDVRIALA